MKITYLGHAGFYVETESTIIVMDPWLSRFGAFDSSWFQYPRNHHMADYVREHFESSTKDKYIYISHEHKDHFDLGFLESLTNRNFKIVIADFLRSIVKESLHNCHYQCTEIISLKHEEEYVIKDGSIRLYIIDAELDCDSAILLKTKEGSFLNINDCKIHEKLSKITKEHGPIDIFAAQFSGAIWHPVCYDMPEVQYQKISRLKKANKFDTVFRAIETVHPKIYIPSAGPPCFLDPMLIDINFQKVNIFPRAVQFIEYLNKRIKNSDIKWPELMPGDMIDVATLDVLPLAKERVLDSNFEHYVRNYASEYTDFFHKREIENKKVNPSKVFADLRQDLENKLQHIHLSNVEVTTLLYWKICDHEQMYCINFKEKTLTVTTEIEDPEHFWMIEAPAWQVRKVLSKEMNWPDFVLTLRVKLARNPDVYNTVIHGFIALDSDEIEHFCDL